MDKSPFSLYIYLTNFYVSKSNTNVFIDTLLYFLDVGKGWEVPVW